MNKHAYGTPKILVKDHGVAIFEKKAALCLAATGRDVDVVAASYEEELEKIAFLGGALRAGRAMLGMAPSRVAAGRLARMTGSAARETAEAGGKKMFSGVGGQPGIFSRLKGWLQSRPGARPSGELTGSARQRAMREFAGKAKPGDPGVTRGSREIIPSSWKSEAPAAAGGGRPINTRRPAARTTAPAGQPQAPVPPPNPEGMTYAMSTPANISGRPPATARPGAATKVIQGEGTPVYRPGSSWQTPSGEVVGRPGSLVSGPGSKGPSASDWLNQRYGLSIGKGEQGVLGGQSVGQWFGGLSGARQAEILAPIGVGGLAAVGLGTRAALGGRNQNVNVYR